MKAKWLLLVIIKSPLSGLILCLQFISTVPAVPAVAAMTFSSYVQTLSAKPQIFGTKKVKVCGNVLDDLSVTLTKGHSCGNWPHLRNGWSDWHEAKRYWVKYVTLTVDLTRDLDLGFLKVRVWNNQIWGMKGLMNMERKGCELIIHDLWVNMVGLVDVRDSDWGDFRHRRAVDTSSF